MFHFLQHDSLNSLNPAAAKLWIIRALTNNLRVIRAPAAKVGVIGSRQTNFV